MSMEVIGSVGGHKVAWDRRTGAVEIKFSSLFTSTWVRLRVRAFTTRAVFDLAEDYLRRRR